MKRIKIFYDSPGWAYHRKASSLQDHAPSDFMVEIGPLGGGEDLEAGLRNGPYDLVFILPIHETAMVWKETVADIKALFGPGHL